MLIKQWRPWDKSTGPRSHEGKAVAAANSLRHGFCSAEAKGDQKRIQAIMRQCLDNLKLVR